MPKHSSHVLLSRLIDVGVANAERQRQPVKNFPIPQRSYLEGIKDLLHEIRAGARIPQSSNCKGIWLADRLQRQNMDVNPLTVTCLKFMFAGKQVLVAHAFPNIFPIRWEPEKHWMVCAALVPDEAMRELLNKINCPL